MDKPYCKCCEYFSITRGSKSLKDSIHCQKHNTVCAVTDENLHGSCSDFKARNSLSITAKALEFGAFTSFLGNYWG